MDNKFIEQTLNNLVYKNTRQSIKKLDSFLSFIDKNISVDTFLDVHSYFQQLSKTKLSTQVVGMFHKHLKTYWAFYIKHHPVQKSYLPIIQHYYPFFSISQQKETIELLKNQLPHYQLNQLGVAKEPSSFAKVLKSYRNNDETALNDFISNSRKISNTTIKKIMGAIQRGKDVNLKLKTITHLYKHASFQSSIYLSRRYANFCIQPYYFLANADVFKNYIDVCMSQYQALKPLTKEEGEQNYYSFSIFCFESLTSVTDFDEFDITKLNKENAYEVLSASYLFLAEQFYYNEKNIVPSDFFNNIDYFFSQAIPYLIKIEKKQKINLREMGLFKSINHYEQNFKLSFKNSLMYKDFDFYRNSDFGDEEPDFLISYMNSFYQKHLLEKTLSNKSVNKTIQKI